MSIEAHDGGGFGCGHNQSTGDSLSSCMYFIYVFGTKPKSGHMVCK